MTIVMIVNSVVLGSLTWSCKMVLDSGLLRGAEHQEWMGTCSQLHCQRYLAWLLLYFLLSDGLLCFLKDLPHPPEYISDCLDPMQ